MVPELVLFDRVEELFPGATEAAPESAQSLDILFSAASPQGLVDMFAAHDSESGRAGEI